MKLRSALNELAARMLGSQTARFRKLDQRRRFIAFRKRWAAVPMLEFTYADRDRLYRFVHDQEIGDGAMDLLEFGSYRGESMRHWITVNKHPASRFFGFDSFEGLPEQWHTGAPSGTFDTGGALPQMDDPRVQFVKGRFQDTLPGFLRGFAARNRLVLHLDADLYSSTLFALVTVNPPPGTLLFFDEFADPMHEFRAFEDFLEASGQRYRVLATRADFGKIAIRVE